MKTKNIKKYISYSCIAILVFSTIYTGVAFNNTTKSDFNLIQEQLEDTKNDFDLEPKASSIKNNYETIESIFTQKLADYYRLGYFPQY